MAHQDAGGACKTPPPTVFHCRCMLFFCSISWSARKQGGAARRGGGGDPAKGRSQILVGVWRGPARTAEIGHPALARDLIVLFDRRTLPFPRRGPFLSAAMADGAPRPRLMSTNCSCRSSPHAQCELARRMTMSLECVALGQAPNTIAWIRPRPRDPGENASPAYAAAGDNKRCPFECGSGEHRKLELQCRAQPQFASRWYDASASSHLGVCRPAAQNSQRPAVAVSNAVARLRPRRMPARSSFPRSFTDRVGKEELVDNLKEKLSG